MAWMPGARHPRLKERVLKRPLRPLFASILAPLWVAGACACSTAAAGNAPVIRVSQTSPTHPSPDSRSLEAFAKQIGVRCDDRGERLDCITGKPEVGDYLDVELHPACTLLAVVAANKAELRDRAAPLDRRTVAMLDHGQRLCIGAIGRAGDHPEYYYVMATAGRPSGCADGRGCRPARNGQIHWVQPMASDCSPALRAAGKTRCASGWLEAEEVTLLPLHG